jgi:peptidoglycan/LPS O-acetylase OafA/YrhL
VTTAPVAPPDAARAESGPRGERFPALDGVRAIAALGVVLTHVGFQTGVTAHGARGGFLARLDAGVALFFVLSGFLLFLPFVRHRIAGRDAPPTGRYLERRALRILPAYWAAAVVCLLFVEDKHGAATGLDWLRHALLLQIYPAGGLREGFTQTWSLCTEVAFYLALPLLAPLVLGRRGPFRPRRVVGVLGGLLVLTIGWLFAAHLPALELRPASSWLPGQVGWFAVGMALAVARARLETGGPAEHAGWNWLLDIARAPGSCVLLGAVLFAIAITPVAGPRLISPTTGWEMIAKHLLYGGAAGLLVLPLVLAPADRSVVHRLLGSKLASWAGELSYSVFLWHLLALAAAFALLDVTVFTGHFWPVLVATLAGTAVLASISYFALERPLMGLRRKVGSRHA